MDDSAHFILDPIYLGIAADWKNTSRKGYALCARR